MLSTLRRRCVNYYGGSTKNLAHGQVFIRRAASTQGGWWRKSVLQNQTLRIVRYSSRTYIVEKSHTTTRNVKNAFSSSLESRDFSPSSRENVLVCRRAVVMRSLPRLRTYRCRRRRRQRFSDQMIFAVPPCFITPRFLSIRVPLGTGVIQSMPNFSSAVRSADCLPTSHENGTIIFASGFVWLHRLHLISFWSLT